MDVQLENDIERVKSEAYKIGVTAAEFEMWRLQAKSTLNAVGLTRESVRRLANKYGRRVW